MSRIFKHASPKTYRLTTQENNKCCEIFIFHQTVFDANIWVTEYRLLIANMHRVIRTDFQREILTDLSRQYKKVYQTHRL